MRDMKLTVSIFALMMSACAASPASAAPECDPGNGGITLPKGFCALLTVDGIGAARHAVAAPNGDLYVALQGRGSGEGGIVGITRFQGRLAVSTWFRNSATAAPPVSPCMTAISMSPSPPRSFVSR